MLALFIGKKIFTLSGVEIGWRIFASSPGKLPKYTAVFHAPSIRVFKPVDKEIIDALLKLLKLICNYGAGLNYYDVRHLTRRGIKLSITSGVVSASKVDSHIYLILAALRKFSHAAHILRLKE